MFVQSLIEESDADKAFVLSQLVPSAKSLAALQEALQRNLIDKVKRERERERAREERVPERNGE
jgi:hypothetical protein